MTNEQFQALKKAHLGSLRYSDRCKVGDRFGRLTVIGQTFSAMVNKRRAIYAMCQCDCGKSVLARADSLYTGVKTSCGCIRIEKLSATLQSRSRKTHPINHPLYPTLRTMIRRCHNPHDKDFQEYGARDIAVCDEWRNDSNAFVTWSLANGWEPGLQIDRINNDAGYDPNNCRFVTCRMNNRNRRDNRPVEAFGEYKLTVEWSEDSRCKVSLGALNQRIWIRGWNAERAISTPPMRRGAIT